MEIYFEYQKINPGQGTVITLGNFDGFHLGHQKIVSVTTKRAQQLNLPSLAITFQPHPRKFFQHGLPILTPLEKKVELLTRAGVDWILIQPFTQKFATMEPEKFITDVLFKALGCRHLVVGYDYSFGKAGAGNTQLLTEYCKEFDVGCEIVDPIRFQGEIISSTAVRNYLAAGHVEKATSFMGRSYSIYGRVVPGAGRGKGLGFPTANVLPRPAQPLPAHGVYMVKVELDGQSHWGMANIGQRPTFDDGDVTVEVFLLDYTGDLYGRTLNIYFCNRIRSEKKFADGGSLKKQLEHDLDQVRLYLKRTVC